MKTECELTEVEKEREASAQRTMDMIRAYKTTFNSPSGRIVLQDLMVSCGIHRTEKHIMEGPVHYREGRRSVFMDILSVLKQKEEDILKALLNPAILDEEDE